MMANFGKAMNEFYVTDVEFTFNDICVLIMSFRYFFHFQVQDNFTIDLYYKFEQRISFS